MKPRVNLRLELLNVLRRWPIKDKSVHHIFTSVPFWMMRDYEAEGQIGLESIPDCLAWARGEEPTEGCCFICNTRTWASEAHRTLRDDGTLVIECNDTYGKGNGRLRQNRGEGCPRNKDKAGIPFRIGLALQADGWYWKSEFPWHKSNALPNKMTDRIHQSHETVLVFSKQETPFWDTWSTLVRDRDNFAVDGRYAINSPGRQGDDSYMRSTDFLYESLREQYRFHINAAQDIAEMMDKSGGRKYALPGLDGVLSVNGGNGKRNTAGFSTFLAETVIRCATGNFGACPECGALYERVVEKEEVGYKDRNFRSDYRVDEAGGVGNPGATGLSMAKRWITVGMKAQCQCRLADWQPTNNPVVLDPFVGGGTTMEVAAGLGCDFIGFDVAETAIEECRGIARTWNLVEKAAAEEDFGPLSKGVHQ